MHAVAVLPQDDGRSILVDPVGESVQLSEEERVKFKYFADNKKTIEKRNFKKNYTRPGVEIFKLAIGAKFSIHITGSYEIKRLD